MLAVFFIGLAIGFGLVLTAELVATRRERRRRP